jgi:hypothetical protein
MSAVPTDRWRAWGEREAQRQHGWMVGGPDALTATFSVAEEDDTWTRALRFALGLRDKGKLIDMPVSAAVAPTVDDATALLAAAGANDILTSEDLSGPARVWLDVRQLTHRERSRAGAVRLRQRVNTFRAEREPVPIVPEPPQIESRNEFCLEGDFWSVRYGGTTSRLKDAKGLHDIARLMVAQGTEVAAVDLIGARTPSSATSSSIPDQGFGIERDAGAVLDTEARQQYRSRLLELEEELTEASAANDPGRAEQARDERAFLLAELRSSVGLHGRTRLAIDPAERARKAVTWRIRDAITRAEVAHEAFGRHLRRSVRTGTFCVYDPPEPVLWVFVGESGA